MVLWVGTRPTPVKAVAQTHGLPVYQPTTFDEKARQTLKELSPDLLVVVAFGMILDEEVLKIPGSAASMCMPLYCQDGVVPLPLNGQSWKVTLKPVFASCKWIRDWIPATSS